MKSLMLSVVCLFFVSTFSIAFAETSGETGNTDQTEVLQATDENQLIEEARQLPSTLITDEERTDLSSVDVENDLNPWQLQYDDIPSDTE